MNDTIFKMYVDLKKLISKAENSKIKGAEECELFQEWITSTEVFERSCADYLPRYERLIKNQESFTPEQIDHICYQIGDWCLMMKPLLEGQHNLGYMKEQLKTMICGD